MYIMLKYLLLCSVVYGFFHNNILPRTNYIGKMFMKDLDSPQRKYHISPMMYEQSLSRLNSKNSTIQDNSVLGFDNFEENKELNIKNYIKKNRKYPLSPKLFEESIRRMSNITNKKEYDE